MEEMAEGLWFGSLEFRKARNSKETRFRKL